ncbi:hypothetical protein CRUP_010360 [Coryphaenoides rupestris]|nr:hypothetical protein CRUP_010360 [Coryphaenoides rupestris]
MYAPAAGIPELIPPHTPPPPGAGGRGGPAGQPFNPGPPQVNGQHGAGGPNHPQRLGHRAPKLGQIGRSKKVDLDDEDLDDLLNNNSRNPASISRSS